MDNELRKERIKAGIERLEKGAFPYASYARLDYFKAYYGLSEIGAYLLDYGGYSWMREEMEANGFKFCELDDIISMLHNWKRFLELIENL